MLQMLQVVDDVVRLGPDGVAGADQADDPAVDGDEQRGLAPGVERLERGLGLGRRA